MRKYKNYFSKSWFKKKVNLYGFKQKLSECILKNEKPS